MSQPEAYCKARLRGLSTTEAASEAGYAGRPPYRVRQLLRRCELIINDMGSVSEAKLLQDIESKKARIAKLQQQMRADLQWLRAVRIVSGTPNPAPPDEP